uniref:C2H2-type domain-containing protein n=1 Tax=Caenorhabditis japonica TaxID=281687 RepID=A0A8R1DNW0_CAEJA
METKSASSLTEFFMEEMVEPVTQALKEKNIDPDEEIQKALQKKIKGLRENLIEEINRAYKTFEKVAVSNDVSETLQNILDTVDDMCRFEPTQIIEPIEVCVSLSEEDTSKSPVSSSSSKKHLPSQKRAKRSLEDTVQMLSDDMRKIIKKHSALPQPHISQSPGGTLPFVLPQVPVPFSNSLMQRWLGSPFANPVYIHAMNMLHHHQQKPDEEQMSALMKVSMQATSFLKNTVPLNANANANAPPQTTSNDSDSEDIKIDIESDDGEVEMSLSPLSGDLTETESSSSAPLSSSPGEVENSAEKPFVCMHNNCGKRFANKFLLKKHMFIHTGLRPHTCPHCHKKFNRKDNLLRHKKTHTSNAGHMGQILSKVNFPLAQIPGLPNISLTPGFSHYHALKMSLEGGAPAVHGLS